MSLFGFELKAFAIGMVFGGFVMFVGILLAGFKGKK